MANPVRFKRRSAAGGAGAPASLLSAEPAVNFADNVLYIGIGDDGNGNATSILPFGGTGAFVSLSGAQTIPGLKTFSTAPKSSVAAAANDDLMRKGEVDTAISTAVSGLATQSYVTTAVDNARQGISAKDAVRMATTANITLSGVQTVDGITGVADDRVLVKNQTTGSQNGIYLMKSGAWVRTTDFDANADVANGAFVFVEEGSTQADTGWVLSNDGVVTVGTTALTFVQFSGAGQITAGNGLTKTGNSIDVVGTANRITVSADAIDIASTYVGQTSITTLGTIATGTWNGTAIGLQYGGTGSNLSAAPDGSIFKKSGTGLVAATAGTDFLNSSSTIDGGTF